MKRRWLLVLLVCLLTVSGCASSESGGATAESSEPTSRVAVVEDEVLIAEQPASDTPTPTSTPTPSVVVPPDVLPLYGDIIPFDFVIERYTYTVQTGEYAQIQTVMIEHNGLQPATRYTVRGFDISNAIVTVLDDTVDFVSAFGDCVTQSADEFNVSNLLGQHWLRTIGQLEFFELAEPPIGRVRGLPTERYVFSQRVLVDADDQLDGIVGTVESYRFNGENYITLRAAIDAQATGNPITGETEETSIQYRYDLTIPEEGFGIERSAECTDP